MNDRVVSHYRVLDLLGEGGMGVVYKAEDTRLKRIVALKFLSQDLTGTGEHADRFLREAQAAAALDHPNICTVYEIDEADGSTFLAMAYLEGESLEDRIRRGPLPLDSVYEIGKTGGGGPGRRSCCGRGASRYQAVQHHARRGSQRTPGRYVDGFRLGPDVRCVEADQGGHPDGHHRLHVARADSRRDRRPA